ncbi:hypothetical protein D9615_001550 [Tricholomella constricta]|uniref:SH3 domain-containing protein n=1 Tax=Tricholomella constricta TaxID=117010 RepID=A0A8H5HP88_9AGAR|nr:hypothetical protein D9615_001550 [Tricholomella constricta]
MTRAMQRRAHGRRRLNFLEHRATETEAVQSSAPIVEPTPSPTVMHPVSLPPTSTTALAAIVSVVGAAIILGIVIWRYRSYKRQNAQATSSLNARVTIEKDHHSEKHVDLANISIYTEKPQKAVLPPRSFDIEVGWVPQTKMYPAVDVSLPAPTASIKSKTKSSKVQLSVKTSETPLDLARSPPPSYFLANGGFEGVEQSPRLIPIPPSPAMSTNIPPPPTPPANRRTKASFASQSEQPPLPAPSPRSESFAAHDVAYPDPADSSSDESSKDQKLPRLMSVATTFMPTLDDELAIKLGDTVRMLEEYRDGWCLVQRVGRIDAPRGAVPRFCLQERRGVVPIMPTRKFSNGSLKSQSGWR